MIRLNYRSTVQNVSLNIVSIGLILNDRKDSRLNERSSLWIKEVGLGGLQNLLFDGPTPGSNKLRSLGRHDPDLMSLSGKISSTFNKLM